MHVEAERDSRVKLCLWLIRGVDVPCFIGDHAPVFVIDGRVHCSVAYGLWHYAFSISHRVCRAEPQLFGDVRKGYQIEDDFYVAKKRYTQQMEDNDQRMSKRV